MQMHIAEWHAVTQQHSAYQILWLSVFVMRCVLAQALQLKPISILKVEACCTIRLLMPCLQQYKSSTPGDCVACGLFLP